MLIISKGLNSEPQREMGTSGSRCSHFRAAQEDWHSTERSLGTHPIETYMARIMPPRMLRVPGDQ